MADVRLLVSWGYTTALEKDRCSNTLYFSVDGGLDDPDYQSLANDVRNIYLARTFCAGQVVEVRAYNMADAKPRPERAFATGTAAGSVPGAANQVALCLSYYSERNLPRQRGRIYTGPWPSPTAYATPTQTAELITMASALAGVGGVNVDWSIWSPTKAAAGQDASMSITEAWVDNSWDIIRSRKLEAKIRSRVAINE